MITNFFIPELNNHDVQELWFQQDGATCHTARATIDLLKDTFGDRLISRFGPVNWPPRSCDLTPLDYFLWGYVKPLVYADKPQTLDHLENNIRSVIADIRPQMLEKVIENWTSRLDYIPASRSSHMPQIIFRMRVARHLGHSDCILRSFGDQWIRDMSFTGRPCQTCHRKDSHISGAVYEETELQMNGTRSSLATNADSISGVMTNRVYVWRPRGERLNPAFALQQHTATTDGVIVWGIIAYNTRSP
ncbi:transposable element Tcb2 transposase [Trichonephila clavipes]|nr:transposable element Tcb2 transposase [Trichonephila clavipes]